MKVLSLFSDEYTNDEKDKSVIAALAACIVVLLLVLIVIGFCVCNKMKSYKKSNIQIGPQDDGEKKTDIPPSYTVALETPTEPTQTVVEPFEGSSPMLTPRTLETLKVTPPPDASTTNPPPPPTYRDLYPKRSNTVM